MWQYNYTCQNDELMHYGVLGMRWGVKKDPVKAYRKATKKMNTLNDNVKSRKSRYIEAETKANTGVAAKYKTLQTKADYINAKAEKVRYKEEQKPKGFWADHTKSDKIQRKADKIQRKANRYKSRAMKRIQMAELTKTEYFKAMHKADKWCKSMEKAFRGMDMESLSQSSIERGRKYVENAA